MNEQGRVQQHHIILDDLLWMAASRLKPRSDELFIVFA